MNWSKPTWNGDFIEFHPPKEFVKQQVRRIRKSVQTENKIAAVQPVARRKRDRRCMEFNYSSRRQAGSIAEFGVAIMVLICFVLLPLLNLSFIPVRYVMCEGIMSELTRRLAHSDKFSEAQTIMAKDQWWKNVLATCGVTTKGETLRMVVTTSDGTKAITSEGGKLPDEWLPGGANGPCIYSLEVKADCTIAALYQGPFPPVNMTIRSHSQWENLSKDPESLKYFINE